MRKTIILGILIILICITNANSAIKDDWERAKADEKQKKIASDGKEYRANHSFERDSVLRYWTVNGAIFIPAVMSTSGLAPVYAGLEYFISEQNARYGAGFYMHTTGYGTFYNIGISYDYLFGDGFRQNEVYTGIGGGLFYYQFEMKTDNTTSIARTFGGLAEGIIGKNLGLIDLSAKAQIYVGGTGLFFGLIAAFGFSGIQ